MSRAMGSHHSHRAGTTTWLTPPHIIEDLGPFDMDPCAAPGWKTADRHVILPEDGLSTRWEGRVWLNPPYGQEAWTWLDRLADHNHGTALIFARTETAGFVEQVWAKATAVLFLHGRLHFHYPDGTRANANSGAPSVLVAYGGEDAWRLQCSNLPGTFMPLEDATVRDDGAGINRQPVIPAWMADHRTRKVLESVAAAGATLCHCTGGRPCYHCATIGGMEGYQQGGSSLVEQGWGA